MYEISMNNEVCVLFKMGIGKILYLFEKISANINLYLFSDEF